MKLKFTQLFIFICTSAFSIAQDLNEPNNDILSSTPITCGSLTTAYIQTVSDKDWYEVQLSQAGTLSAAITGAPNNLDLNLEWYHLVNSVQQLIAMDNDLNAGGGQLVVATGVVPAGIYYLSIEEEDNNTANMTSSYSFTVTCLPSEFELNQTISEAATIPADTCLEERIWGNNQDYFNSTTGADDKDWYAVTLPESGYLKAELIVPASIDMNLELYRQDSPLPVLLADDNDLSASSGQDLSLAAYLDAGTYYFHLEDEGNNATSEETYLFCVEYEPSPFEVNQTLDLAIPIPADTCLEEKILGDNRDFFNSTDGDNDQDWFAISLNESGYLSVDLIVPGAIDMNMELYRQDGFTELLLDDDSDASASPGQDLFMTTFLDAGTYFLHLEDEQNNTSLDESYQLCVEFYPNEFEVNQSIDLAANIPKDTCFQERIWGENFEFETSQDGNDDQDWYEFVLTDSCALLVEVTNVPTVLDLNAEIIKLENIQQILVADDGIPFASGGQPLEIQTILPAGTFYLHIEDEGHNALSEELFNLCVSCTSINTNSIESIQNQIAIYPNPADDQILIEGIEQGEYDLLDQTGRIEKHGALTDTIDVSSLQSGIYFLRFKVKGQTIISKIVKE